MTAIAPQSIVDALPAMARELPEQIAIRVPGSRKNADGFAAYDEALTFAELDRQTRKLASGLLLKTELNRGDRVVVMLKPSLDFFVVMFALFRAGLVPVLIDPGIPRKALKACLKEAQPQGFIGIRLAVWAKRLLGWAPSANVVIVDRQLQRYFIDGTLEFEPDGEDVAAILFTSGSTGVPKGVEYRHRHFVGQLRMLGEAFSISPGGVDLPTFPPFALFDPALGLTSIIPDMDARKPAEADPRKLHDAMTRFGVAQLFGSPALMKVLVDYDHALEGVKRVTSAGAPVPSDTVSRMLSLLDDDAQFWTPYGATECLPVAVIEGRELLTTREATETGAGTCVGLPLAENTVRIIRIVDGPIASWSDTVACAAYEVGEITVKGPSATDTYFNRPDLTSKAKIIDGDAVVHRMGDVGYFDEQGRLWFCGRMTQRVKTLDGELYTERVEPIFNTHPEVSRSALVGVDGVPVMMIETQSRNWPALEIELCELAQQHEGTRGITTFLKHAKFPVDIRHNAKIQREALTLEARKRLS